MEFMYDADRECANKNCVTCKHQDKKFFCKIHFYIDKLIAHGVTVQDKTEISDELLKQLRNAPITILHEEPTIELVQQWISVKDRLPENGKKVLVYCKENKNDYEIGAYSDTYMGFFVRQTWYENITHWMPLPEPPKGE